MILSYCYQFMFIYMLFPVRCSHPLPTGPAVVVDATIFNVVEGDQVNFHYLPAATTITVMIDPAPDAVIAKFQAASDRSPEGMRTNFGLGDWAYVSIPPSVGPDWMRHNGVPVPALVDRSHLRSFGR